jgi:broad specificity phosphatase PhoE
MTRLTLVRHGETEGQSSVRYHGRNDVPLNAHGRAQMAAARDALGREAFAAVYASTLSRSVESAAIVGRTTDVIRVAGFDEIHFGEWEGLTVEEIRARDPQRYAQWAASRGDFHYPGGESTSGFRRRVTGALHDLLAGAPPGHLLLVVHKGIIRSTLAELLRLEEHQRRELVVDLASIHVISRANGVWQPEVLDRTDHLQ